MPILHWLTREHDLHASGRAPYRLLKHVETYGDPHTQNMLIQGDNLDALKALLPYYAGKVKCIYIDPPYNTKTAFEHYDDNLEHSVWLAMMYPRLELLRELLHDEGSIFVNLDDHEVHYAKVIIDEIFGRKNFLNQLSVKMKQTSGASGGGEDKKLKKNIEYILIYMKDKERFTKFNEVFEEEDLFDLIYEMRDSGKSWKYTRIITNYGKKTYVKTIQDGAGEDIRIFEHHDFEFKTIRDLMKEDSISEEECYCKYYDHIFRDTNAQSSIRTRVMDATQGLSDLISIEYTPKSGRHKGILTTLYYKGHNRDLIAWLKDICEKKGNKLKRLGRLGTYWDGFPLNNLTKEGSVKFPQGKKPEALVKQILSLCTVPGDIVLDSFLGSGTTAAVAHKMGRQYIGIEIGDHAVTHCVPRLQKVIEGEQGGISSLVNWQGGGGFRFYHLGSPIFEEDGAIYQNITFAQLAAHVWFCETGVPLQEQPVNPFLGIHDGTAYYLLYNGILKDKKANGGNVLTKKILEALPPHDGARVIYGERSLFGAEKLKAMGIVFKQTPYDIKGQ